MTDSNAFSLLDERIQRYIWREGWTGLRDAQEQATPLIIKANRDVIVAAATASGKTEAAFLPALTHILETEPVTALIVYISPLKALINDQFGRMERLCEDLEVPVWPWHGDISSSIKTRFLKRPSGVLLITPEAVEATLCNRGTAVASIFAQTAFFVIDELHAFIGTERGKQLQSLLHRIERAIGRTVPRIGLSATLGDMALAAEFLRPGSGQHVAVVESKSDGWSLQIRVKGYEEPATLPQTSKGDDKEPEPMAPRKVAEDLYRVLRGSQNLVFPNSRRQVEVYSHLLATMCADRLVPNEFWPHHGSLSKEIRTETEQALKRRDQPATGICTTTLELGIDIGAVKSVAQIGPAPSVASLRQRLGRSGRRKGEAATLRAYCIEDEIALGAGLSTELRLGTLQTSAMISLLLDHWCEPPKASGLHLSTLIQQLLSLIAQRGGVSAGEAFATLCGNGAPFCGVTPSDFKDLLRHMASKELIVQDSSGVLLHGRVGEKFVNHYTFYAAFASDEEYRIVAGDRTLGSLPIVQLVTVGQQILFAGKTWRVDEVSDRDKAIYVSHTRGGAPPLFSGGGGRVHTHVRQRMREILRTHEVLTYLDATAAQLVEQGRANYQRLDLDRRTQLDQGDRVLLLTWLGDDANEAIACLLGQRGWIAAAAGPGVEVQKRPDQLLDGVLDELAQLPMPSPVDLLSGAANLEREKWDWALPAPLLAQAYASLHLNLDEALDWLKNDRLALVRPHTGAFGG